MSSNTVLSIMTSGYHVFSALNAASFCLFIPTPHDKINQQTLGTTALALSPAPPAVTPDPLLGPPPAASTRLQQGSRGPAHPLSYSTSLHLFVSSYSPSCFIPLCVIFTYHNGSQLDDFSPGFGLTQGTWLTCDTRHHKLTMHRLAPHPCRFRGSSRLCYR